MNLAMALQYYYRINESVSGPVPFLDLVALAREKSLNLDDAVRLEGHSEWGLAGEVPSLFHMAGRADEVSRWRVERREKGAGGRIQGSENPEETVEVAVDESSELSREIKAATYEAALQWQSKHQQAPGVVAVERDSRLRAVMGSLASGVRRGLVCLLSLPFSLIDAIWARTGIQFTIPGWLERFLGLLFSHRMLIVVFRWGMTLAVPNLVAWGIFSWSNMEAQRYPSRDPSQISPKMFPGWGVCSSEGEFLFLLIDLMLIVAVATYIGIRWLEAKADD